MSRSRRAPFLILIILWQALVWLTPWGQEQRVADLANTVAHAHATAHHHHDDDSLRIELPLAQRSTTRPILPP